MQLAELDGFLAGIIIHPTLILPREWLPVIWHREEPEFADLLEAQTILGIVMCRYNEINHLLDAGPGTYRPLIGPNGADASDWTLGFLRAMQLDEEAWLPLLRDPDAGVLLAPVMMIASTTERADLTLDPGEQLPPAEMRKLLAEAAPLLGQCVAGMRLFFRRPRRQAVGGKRRVQPKAK
jgi:yecA family protein